MNTSAKYHQEFNSLEYLFSHFLADISVNTGITGKVLTEKLDSSFGFNLHYEDNAKYQIVLRFLKESVIPHKINVFNAGVELIDKFKGYELNEYNIRYAQFIRNLTIHDLSKFSEMEAFGYAQWFSDSEKKDRALFDLAWHNHKMCNKHHPEYWFSVQKNGTTQLLEMPMPYIIEMVAAWVGAGMSYGNAIDTWLPDNLPLFVFHENTCKNLQFVLRKLEIETTINGNFMKVI